MEMSIGRTHSKRTHAIAVSYRARGASYVSNNGSISTAM
jgi:hypothetical protein